VGRPALPEVKNRWRILAYLAVRGRSFTTKTPRDTKLVRSEPELRALVVESGLASLAYLAVHHRGRRPLPRSTTSPVDCVLGALYNVVLVTMAWL